jgi:carboxypeptidase C (cathepsin A)
VCWRRISILKLIAGAGPCQITPEGELVESSHPWTDVTNLLILDIPLGSGWSFSNNEDGIANSSSWAAAEVDDTLQVCIAPLSSFSAS